MKKLTLVNHKISLNSIRELFSFMSQKCMCMKCKLLIFLTLTISMQEPVVVKKMYTISCIYFYIHFNLRQELNKHVMHSYLHITFHYKAGLKTATKMDFCTITFYK